MNFGTLTSGDNPPKAPRKSLTSRTERYLVKMEETGSTIQEIEVCRTDNPASFDNLKKVIVKSEQFGGKVMHLAHLPDGVFQPERLRFYTRTEVMDIGLVKQ